MKQSKPFRVARCIEADGPFELTVGRYYIVQDEYVDIEDMSPMLFVMNDLGQTINLRKERFESFKTVREAEFRDLNLSHFHENSDLVHLNPGMSLTFV